MLEGTEKYWLMCRIYSIPKGQLVELSASEEMRLESPILLRSVNEIERVK